MILFTLIFLLVVYIHFGILVLIQIILWLIVFITSNFISRINPSNIQFQVIRVMSVCVILFILWYNSRIITISTAIIFPVSIGSISYLHESNEMIYF